VSVRVQVILDETEAAIFKSQAAKESKSLSAWLRDAGKEMLKKNGRKQGLSDPGSLKAFFEQCKERERGTEPDWEEQKNLLLESYRGGNGV
jgi:hypothetical protein